MPISLILHQFTSYYWCLLYYQFMLSINSVSVKTVEIGKKEAGHCEIFLIWEVISKMVGLVVGLMNPKVELSGVTKITLTLRRGKMARERRSR